MKTSEIKNLYDKLAIWTSGELKFEVRIMDSKQAFGRVDVLISPVAGVGEQWVSLEKVTIEE
jgi:hypothetical protein